MTADLRSLLPLAVVHGSDPVTIETEHYRWILSAAQADSLSRFLTGAETFTQAAVEIRRAIGMP